MKADRLSEILNELTELHPDAEVEVNTVGNLMVLAPDYIGYIDMRECSLEIDEEIMTESRGTK